MNSIFNVDSSGAVALNTEAAGETLSLARSPSIGIASRSWPLFLSVGLHVVALLALGWGATKRASAAPAPLVFFDLAPAPALGVEGGTKTDAATKSVARPRARRAQAHLTPHPFPAPSPRPEPEAETAEAEAEPSEETRDAQAPPAGQADDQEGGTLGGRVDGTGAGTGQALNLSQVSQPPRVLERVTPDYPRSAKAVGLEGRVVIRIVLDAEGRVEPSSARVVRSVPALDTAALEAVSRWRFSPALGPDQRPVRVQLDIPFQFSLR